jgi:uncharacterized protein (DUF488 family)
MTSQTLCTIGYEKALLKDVLASLAAAGVATLIDVRDRPISRRPGFSKRQLTAGVDDAGMRYLHLRALGTPPEGRLANRRGEWGRFWAIVEERLASAEAELALQEAAEVARAAPSCLLCYEADWHICHRRRVAEILAQRHGFTIRHLAVYDTNDGGVRLTHQR